MTKEESQEMAGYILSILKADIIKFYSWGVDEKRIITVDGGLQFHVEGFLHTGNVVVKYEEGKDLFRVTLHKDDSPEEVETYTDIYFDELADFIDSKVEYTGKDYVERVDREFTIIKIG